MDTNKSKQGREVSVRVWKQKLWKYHILVISREKYDTFEFEYYACNNMHEETKTN
jgi:hypothetical protein